MRVAICEEKKTNQWTISVVDVSPADLTLNGDGYVVRKGAKVETVTAAKATGGAKNAKARTKRLANRHDAVVLTDTETIRGSLEVHGVDPGTTAGDTGAEVFNQADMFAAMDAEETPAAAAAAPEETEPPRRRRRRRRRASEPEAAVPPPVEDPPKVKRRKRAAAPEPLPPEPLPPEPTAPPKARKARKATPPPADPPAPAAAPRGYVVRASRKSWEKVAGATREYDLGQTPDPDEAEEVAARWRADGFDVVIVPLPAHHKARDGKNTLFTGDPVEPILCQSEACAWAGDHLGPHLKSHGITLDQYRQTYGYKGESMVGRAAMALRRAHKSVRRRNDLKVGMIVVRIEGDARVEVWRVDAVDRAAKALDVVLVNRDLFGDTPADRTISLSEFFTLFQPVGTWSKRMVRDTRRDWAGA